MVGVICVLLGYYGVSIIPQKVSITLFIIGVILIVCVLISIKNFKSR